MVSDKTGAPKRRKPGNRRRFGPLFRLAVEIAASGMAITI